MHNERLIRGEDEQQEEPELDKQERRTGMMCDDGWARESSEIVESVITEAIKMRERLTASERNLC